MKEVLNLNNTKISEIIKSAAAEFQQKANNKK
jgi:hypothetical protein